MEPQVLRAGFKRAIACKHSPAKRRVVLQPRRFYATPTQDSIEPIRSAAPIRFSSDPNQFAQSRAQYVDDAQSFAGGNNNGDISTQQNGRRIPLLNRIRIVPASPSYFTATPRYTDDYLYLLSLKRKHELLPVLPQAQAPRVAWKTLEQYKTELGEPVRAKGHSMLIGLLRRLNQIHPALMPVEVERAMARYKRLVQPHLDPAKPIVIDELGRARAVGRRKSSNAVVYLIEGNGECLINGRTLTEYFGRLHDRESAMWPLKATARLDKYNVWAIAQGGGTTGQAEAITLGLAKALLVHEPGLKAPLRKAGCITRDVRRVERKKAGKLKARKMPTWVKR